MTEPLHHSTEPPRFTYGDYVRWQGDERWVQKRDVYERHGVREFWVLDLDQRTVVRHRLDGERFRAETLDASGSWGPEIFAGLSIAWDLVVR